MSKKAYLRVGQIVRAHGVQGALKVVPATDDTERFRSLSSAYVEDRGAYRPVSVVSVQLLNDAAAVKLEGINTREAAEALRGKYLCVDRAHTVELPADTYFVSDLIGCETFDTEGKAYGKITDVIETGANDVYEIDHGKLMVPALKKVLHLVDTEHDRIEFDAEVLREVGLFAD